MNIKHSIKSGIEKITGYFIYKINDLPVGVSLKYDIQYKLPKIKINTIFDVGANVGQTALQFSEDFPAAKIYSFEPISGTFKKLQANTKNNPAVVCNNIAFGDKSGEMKVSIFGEDTDSGLNSLISSNMNLNADSSIEMIKVDTIDEFMAANVIQEIDLLKIDTEGFEINVLNGAANALKNNKIKLIYLEIGMDDKVNKRHQNLVDIQLYFKEKNYVFVGLYDIIHIFMPIRFHYANALFVSAEYL